MLLSALIGKLGIDIDEVINFRECEVLYVTDNSREVTRGSVFVAIKGRKNDGRRYMKEAARLGACLAICEDEIDKSISCSAIKCKNARKSLAEISKILYGDPSEKMKIVGITGTKGKTTTTEYLRVLLSASGISTVSCGTLGANILGKRVDIGGITTPSAPKLYKLLNEAASAGASVAIIEVSSQALVDYRVAGLRFDTVIYTGFSYDHIGEGEHKDLRDYFSAKRRLFTDYGAECAIVIDDGENSKRISYGVEKVIRCGSEPYDEYYLGDVYTTSLGVGFILNSQAFELSMSGKYNARNAALALAAAEHLTKRNISYFAAALRSAKVRGRFEIYELSGKYVIIDFAHNADSIRCICQSVRGSSVGRIITVFGSVGERAYKRRREIALAAEEFSDFSVITSDNPCGENPTSICEDIRSYFLDRRKTRIIVDRKEAIRHAIELAEVGDYVLLLGKGHEEYQLTSAGSIRFSEREILLSLGATPIG